MIQKKDAPVSDPPHRFRERHISYCISGGGAFPVFMQVENRAF